MIKSSSMWEVWYVWGSGH